MLLKISSVYILTYAPNIIVCTSTVDAEYMIVNNIVLDHEVTVRHLLLLKSLSLSTPDFIGFLPHAPL
jgi:hypothetical protein